MIWIKFCGMRSAADVAAAESAGADAVGFVTAARSVRQVSPSEAAEYSTGCSIERFLVTEDETPDSLLTAAEIAGVTGVQPHGEHSREAATAALQAGLKVLFPIPVGDAADASVAPAGTMPLLDGTNPGSGVRFDPTMIAYLPDLFVLAGGLTPETVREIAFDMDPYGVDVSSGIESAPGVKDAELMARFVEALQ
jgi:phosphoribosylanthranilate isomerase